MLIEQDSACENPPPTPRWSAWMQRTLLEWTAVGEVAALALHRWAPIILGVLSLRAVAVGGPTVFSVVGATIGFAGAGRRSSERRL